VNTFDRSSEARLCPRRYVLLRSKALTRTTRRLLRQKKGQNKGESLIAHPLPTNEKVSSLKKPPREFNEETPPPHTIINNNNNQIKMNIK
jgi:hypothetical protein